MPARTDRAMPLSQRIFFSVILTIFLGVGTLLAGLMGRSIWTGLKTHGWAPVECVVLESQIETTAGTEDKPELRVRYRYEYGGREFVSNRWTRGMASAPDAADVYRLQQQLAPGTRTTAYVDPADPEQAVLRRGSMGSAVIMAFPLLFVAVGGGGLVFVWRPRRGGKAIARTEPKPAISGRAGRWMAGLFFGAFFAVGIGVGTMFFLQPLLRIREAQSWDRVPCQIVSSAVRSQRTNDETTYRIEVIYRYTVGGREYTSGRYQFISGSSSGSAEKAAVVAKLPAGARAECYVNPADPTDAVIERGITPDLWIGVVPLAFVILGAGGLVYMVRKRGAGDAIWATSAAAPKPRPRSPAPARSFDGTMRPAHSRRAKFFALLGFAIFWNGILAVFLWPELEGWRTGQVDWGAVVFFGLFFAGPGVAIGVAALREGLASFNPEPRLTLRPSAVPVGGTVEVSWTLEGRIHSIRRLRLTLEGQEEATYRSGKNTRTARETFATIEVVETTEPGAMRTGSAQVALPVETMHSFESAHHRIAWSLRVHGEIGYWPDLDEEFPLTVEPRPRLPR